MKIVFVFVALLVCANLDFCPAAGLFGNQIPSETEGEKIDTRASDESDVSDFQIPSKNDGENSENIIDARANDPGCLTQTKPSAHIEAVSKLAVDYHANKVIKDWTENSRFSDLAGGMTYRDGVLQVPISGRYYIYTQLYFHGSNGRAYLNVNNQHVTMIQVSSGHQASLYAGGVFKLNTGDRISVVAGNNIRLYMDSIHCYFGAYLI